MKQKTQTIFFYFIHEWKIILISILSGVIFNVFAVYGPIYQGKLLDKIHEGASVKELLFSGLVFVGIIVFIQGNRFLKRFFVRDFANRTTKTMRQITYQNVLRQDQNHTLHMGSILTKLVSDVDLTVEGMRKCLTEVFDTGIAMIAYMVALFSYGVKITAFSILFIPLAYIVAALLKTKIANYTSHFRKEDAKSTQATYDYIEHMILYKTHGVSSSIENRVIDKYKSYQKSAVQSNFFEATLQPIYHMISSLGLVFFLYYGLNYVSSGQWTVGVFTAYSGILLAFILKSSKVSKLFIAFQKAKISWNRIVPYLEEIKEPEIENSIEPIETIEFLDYIVDISSDLHLPPISLTLNKGMILGITGPIGCGKTSFLDSIMKECPSRGKILINGIEGKQASISMMHHKPYLIQSTILENITLGKESKNIDELLATVDFLPDLAQMPQGINTVVGSSGHRLSGGQQQRISLARILFLNANLILLDDPLSALDYKTEEKVISALKEQYKDSIILIASHRIHHFDQFDKVLYLSKKESICLPHPQLYESLKVYRDLFDQSRREEESK